MPCRSIFRNKSIQRLVSPVFAEAEISVVHWNIKCLPTFFGCSNNCVWLVGVLVCWIAGRKQFEFLHSLKFQDPQHYSPHILGCSPIVFVFCQLFLVVCWLHFTVLLQCTFGKECGGGRKGIVFFVSKIRSFWKCLLFVRWVYNGPRFSYHLLAVLQEKIIPHNTTSPLAYPTQQENKPRYNLVEEQLPPKIKCP